MAGQRVFAFSELAAAQRAAGEDRDAILGLLGGKGAHLAEMTRLELPVPPGFTISTAACREYLQQGELPADLWNEVLAAIAALEQTSRTQFGGHPPLLISVRSGAKFSMPGMMDTVLNIGLTDHTAQALISHYGDERLVFDLYRRLLQMFGSVVLEIDGEAFEGLIEKQKKTRRVELDVDLQAEDWQTLTEKFKALIERKTGQPFPQDPFVQLRMAVEAVFTSWNGKRAVDYRNAAGIPHSLGTAVNVQLMVFGNMGSNSGTGVAFTRNPASGEKGLYGDYLINAQGEDVVAGIRKTRPIAELEHELPSAFAQLTHICQRLEAHYADMQDIEFTIQADQLWMLQTRSGKRTAQAAVRIATDLANEGLITQAQAVQRVSTDQMDALLHPQFETHAVAAARQGGQLLTQGVNASPGAAVGRIYFDATTAERKAKQDGQAVIMVRPFTRPDDVHGMLAAKGILTSEGGATSHAAVVARQFGVPCVVGAAGLQVDVKTRHLRVNGKTLKEGDWLSLDGSTGEVFAGQLPSMPVQLEQQDALMRLLKWADELSLQADGTSFEVWANADTPADAGRARSYGARGIGLCRTEHMFFAPERLPIVQRMILAEDPAQRKAALKELLPLQQRDFEGLFKVMDGLPVIIRLIDPPLHEFLPSLETLIEEVATLRAKGGRRAGLGRKEALLARVRSLHESNPMMGLRGVRLSIVMPEIVEMQTRAIFRAAAKLARRGLHPKPEVMIPLVGHINELKFIHTRLEQTARQVLEKAGVQVDYKFGTMIEVPRAALTAGEIAQLAEFFSFGTNDLTQMTYGFSRDDAEASFLLEYVEQAILPVNPFQTLDADGVGRLMQMAVADGRRTRPDLHIGICGEHGGDPASVAFCYVSELNYVSCSPFRVPVARLAAAQAALAASA